MKNLHLFLKPMLQCIKNRFLLCKKFLMQKLMIKYNRYYTKHIKESGLADEKLFYCGIQKYQVIFLLKS